MKESNNKRYNSKSNKRYNSKNNSKGIGGINETSSPQFSANPKYDYITGENSNSYQSTYRDVSVSFDNALLQTILVFPFGTTADASEDQANFGRTQFQNALNVATRRSVSYKINNSWDDHYAYFNTVSLSLQKYYSIKAIIDYVDYVDTKNACINKFSNSAFDASVRDKMEILKRTLEMCYFPRKVHEYIYNIYKLRLSGLSGNTTVLGYTCVDFSSIKNPSTYANLLATEIEKIRTLLTNGNNNDVATNLAALFTRTNAVDWRLRIQDMPAALGFDEEYMNLFMNSCKEYRTNRGVSIKFPNSEYMLTYTKEMMDPSTVISLQNKGEPGLILPTSDSINSLSYLISDLNDNLTRITQQSDDSQTAMFGTPGYFVSTVGGAIYNVKNLQPGGKLTFGTSGQNRTSLINNVLFEMFEISALK